MSPNPVRPLRPRRAVVLTALVLHVAGISLVSPALAAAPHVSAAAPAVSTLSTLSAADDAKRIGFGVVPATPEGVDKRAFFSYGLAPGAVAYDHVALLNYSDKPVNLGVAAADSVNSDQGGFALQASADQRLDVGAWVKVGKSNEPVKVPGRTSDGQPGTVILPVTITVPKDASPGDHAGGVLAVLTTMSKNPQGQNIRLEQRVASRVYIKVAGPVKPGLAFQEIRAAYEPGTWPWQAGRVTLTYTRVNTGNVRMGFDPTVRVSGPFGLGGQTVDLDPVDELLPHNSQTQTTTIEGVWPLIRMDGRVSADPLGAVAAPIPDLAQVNGSVGLWAFAWWLFGLVLIVAGLVLWAWQRRRRRGAPGAADPSPATSERDRYPEHVGA